VSYLILAHLDDETALLCAAMLRRMHGQDAVDVLSPEALAMAPRWIHTLTAAPQLTSPVGLQVNTEIALASGRLLTDEGIKVVFNRLRWADPPHFTSAAAIDRDYASAEMSALWVSWLAGLQDQGIPVINPPAHGGLQPSSNRLEWLKFAAEAGLPVVRIHVGGDGKPTGNSSGGLSILIAGEQILPFVSNSIGDVSEFQSVLKALQGELTALQKRTGCRLLELRIVPATGTADGNLVDDPIWRVAAVNPFPVVRDRAGIEAIVMMLEVAGR